MTWRAIQYLTTEATEVKGSTRTRSFLPVTVFNGSLRDYFSLSERANFSWFEGYPIPGVQGSGGLKVTFGLLVTSHGKITG